MPITEVVYECGFSDHSHFTRTFNRLEGMPPREWRRAFVANRAPIALQLPAIELDAALWSVHNAGHAHPSHA
jgi:AraC-like DNA-binding protein